MPICSRSAHAWTQQPLLPARLGRTILRNCRTTGKSPAPRNSRSETCKPLPHLAAGPSRPVKRPARPPRARHAKPAAGRRDAAAIWWAARASEAGFAGMEALTEALAVPRFRLAQIYRAAAKELRQTFSEVTVLPVAMRTAFGERMRLASVELAHEATSGDGQTTKFLFTLADGKKIEAVLMRHKGGRITACISSQAGCALKCDFCATGQGGFFRHMTALEIFDQAAFVARRARDEDK